MFGLITIEDFAKDIKTSKSTIYSWKQRGDIPLSCFKQIGGRWFVKVKQMEDWLENNP